MGLNTNAPITISEYIVFNTILVYDPNFLDL